MKILIIIPAYNEVDSIEKVIQSITNNTYKNEVDYIIINDGSTDSMPELCEKKGFNLINLPINLGIGGAVQTGYKYALTHGYDIAVQMDGDGQHDSKYLDDMADLLIENKADLVIGSRFVEKQGFQSSSSRRMGISILSIWGWILTGVRVRDITSGYRMVNRRLIEIYASDYPSDYPEPEAMVVAAIWKCGILELPVKMNAREHGKSSINIKNSFYYMIKVSLAMFIRRISLGIRR